MPFYSSTSDSIIFAMYNRLLIESCETLNAAISTNSGAIYLVKAAAIQAGLSLIEASAGNSSDWCAQRQ